MRDKATLLKLLEAEKSRNPWIEDTAYRKKAYDRLKLDIETTDDDKIGNRFLQVRLIQTEKWSSRQKAKKDFTSDMPRAKFINPQDEHFYYLISRKDIIEMKDKISGNKQKEVKDGRN